MPHICTATKTPLAQHHQREFRADLSSGRFLLLILGTGRYLRLSPIAFVEQKVGAINAVEALGQLSLKPGSVVIRHASDGDWCEVTDCSTGKRGRVPASAIQEVKETSAAAPTTTAPEKKKGYTYSSLPSLTGGPKRKIFKQPKKR